MRILVIAIALTACTVRPARDNSQRDQPITCADPGCIDPATGYGDATTGTDGTGWWFASGSWHTPFSGPEGAVITRLSIDLQDNGPGNARPSSPVTVALRSSRDGGGTWSTIVAATSCGCGAEQTLAPDVVYQPAGGEIIELEIVSSTSSPTYVFSVSVGTSFVQTINIAYSSFLNAFPAVHPVDYANARIEGQSLHVLADSRIPPGSAILGFRAVVLDATTSRDDASLVMRCGDGSLQVVATSPLSSGSGTIQLVRGVMLPMRIPPGCTCTLDIDASGQASTAVLMAQVDWL